MDSHWKLWVTDVTVEPRNEAYDNIAKIPKKTHGQTRGSHHRLPLNTPLCVLWLHLRVYVTDGKNRQTAVGNAAS